MRHYEYCRLCYNIVKAKGVFDDAELNCTITYEDSSETITIPLRGSIFLTLFAYMDEDLWEPCEIIYDHNPPGSEHTLFFKREIECYDEHVL